MADLRREDARRMLRQVWLDPLSLDPACGSGNFLYVALEQLKRLEGDPRAAAIAELVLWIGFLQWYFRTRGQVQPPTPIIKNYRNIEHRDAVLAWDSFEPLLDSQGRPMTRWDGRTFKKHPVTGQEVPDESARVPAYKYLNPRPAERRRKRRGDWFAGSGRSTRPARRLRRQTLRQP